MNRWEAIQKSVWDCNACRGRGEAAFQRVSCNTRQQTPEPPGAVKLLLIGIAPPHPRRRVDQQEKAKSATNDPDDRVRLFVEDTLDDRWDALVSRGLFLAHGVKCAIAPKSDHQNPEDAVVDECAPRHLREELNLIRPPRVITFGLQAYRAVLRAIPGDSRIPRKTVTALVQETEAGLDFQGDGWKFKLHAVPFPVVMRAYDPNAVRVLKKAARLSGIVDDRSTTKN